MSDLDASRLSSIKTYLLIAFIFNILTVLGLGIVTAVTLLFIIGIFLVVPLILSVLVLQRVSQMRDAAERGDITQLKALNSVGWAIVGLLFAGVITGIMLLVANGSINELGTSPTGMTSSAPTANSLDQLAKLKSLLDSGAITQAEYEAQKKKILG